MCCHVMSCHAEGGKRCKLRRMPRTDRWWASSDSRRKTCRISATQQQSSPGSPCRYRAPPSIHESNRSDLQSEDRSRGTKKLFIFRGGAIKRNWTKLNEIERTCSWIGGKNLRLIHEQFCIFAQYTISTPFLKSLQDILKNEMNGRFRHKTKTNYAADWRT